MSFFGFDPMAAPTGKSETVNFDELEDDDAFNDDTFGSAAVSNLNKDFDFSNPGNKEANLSLKPAPVPEKSTVSYAAVAHSNIDSMLQPMASLWMDESSKNNVSNNETPNSTTIPSLQEIEAKLKAQSLPPQPVSQPQPQQPNMNIMPGNQPMNMNVNMNMQGNPQFQLPPYITQMLYQPSIQQQIYSAVSSGRFPNLQTATQAMIQMLLSTPNPMMQMHPQFAPQNGMMNMGQMNNQNMQQPPQTPNQLPQSQPQQPVQSQTQSQTSPPQLQQQVHQLQQHVQDLTSQQISSSQHKPAEKKINLNDFPSIEVASAKSNGHVNHSEPVINDDESDDSNDNTFNDYNHSVNDNMNRGNFNNNNRNFQNQNNRSRGYNQMNNQRNQNNRYGHNDHHNFQRQHQLQEQLNHMSPEERENFLIRQRKVSTITRCSGFMTPKDKDFVTRFQLSQIVTDDPYNEDFYSQVYKAINSNNNNNMNSLAQKYLEQSGHRLGGRSKRADVALQRMQQQVSKAVSVAKERGANTGILTKAGALGKVSYGSGKQPRKQLIIPTENNSTEESKDVATDASEVEKTEVVIPKMYTFSKSARAFQLSIIEKIYNEVLKLESLERENEPYETNDLWKTLHINDVIKTSADEVVNPFISILAFDKMMKVFGRMFHLLTETQKEALVTHFFGQLQNIDVIRKGSYKNYTESNYLVPSDIIKKIDLFQVTILNNLVIYISEASFSKVLSWFKLLVENKTTLFLSTTKIGLSIITVLISRLELIKQEISEQLSAHELSQWQNVYNEMFESLEGRLEFCFPPYLSHDDSIKVTNEQSNEDDSYIWQFLASLTLTGKLNHQRVIVDEIRGEIFGVMEACKKYKAQGDFEKAARYMNNLNLFLNAMGLIATEDDITQLAD